MRTWMAIAAAAALSGCASREGEYSWVTHTRTSERGVSALDHVGRRKVDLGTAVRRSYLGETCYFESDRNARVFDANPWAYLYCDNVHLQGRPDRTDEN